MGLLYLYLFYGKVLCPSTCGTVVNHQRYHLAHCPHHKAASTALYLIYLQHILMTHHTYLLHGAVLLEKLTGLQLVKKFPAFYGTRRFITALTSVRHLSLSWASPIQSIYPHPIFWRSILILSTHIRLGLPTGSFPPVSPPRSYTPPSITRTRHMPSQSHSSRFYHPHNIG